MSSCHFMLLSVLCACIGCSEQTPQTQAPAISAAHKPQTDTGRIENSIGIDTTGCLTIEEFDKTATAPASAVPGCIDLDRGLRVIGPLELKMKNIGGEDFEYARIEVPGKGERWTFQAHLAR